MSGAGGAVRRVAAANRSCDGSGQRVEAGLLRDPHGGRPHGSGERRRPGAFPAVEISEPFAQPPTGPRSGSCEHRSRPRRQRHSVPQVRFQGFPRLAPKVRHGSRATRPGESGALRKRRRNDAAASSARVHPGASRARQRLASTRSRLSFAATFLTFFVLVASAPSRLRRDGPGVDESFPTRRSSRTACLRRFTTPILRRRSTMPRMGRRSTRYMCRTTESKSLLFGVEDELRPVGAEASSRRASRRRGCLWYRRGGSLVASVRTETTSTRACPRDESLLLAPVQSGARFDAIRHGPIEDGTMSLSAVAMFTLIFAAFAMFAWSASRRWELLQIGRGTNRLDHIAARLRGTWRYAFRQEKMDYYNPAGIGPQAHLPRLRRSSSFARSCSWGRGFYPAVQSSGSSSPGQPLGRDLRVREGLRRRWRRRRDLVFFYYRLVVSRSAWPSSGRASSSSAIIFTMMIADMIYDGASLVLCFAEGGPVRCGNARRDRQAVRHDRRPRRAARRRALRRGSWSPCPCARRIVLRAALS